MTQSIVIYNCEACMFITMNKKGLYALSEFTQAYRESSGGDGGHTLSQNMWRHSGIIRRIILCQILIII